MRRDQKGSRDGLRVSLSYRCPIDDVCAVEQNEEYSTVVTWAAICLLLLTPKRSVIIPTKDKSIMNILSRARTDIHSRQVGSRLLTVLLTAYGLGA